MDFSDINFFAVIAATLSTFVVGWVWYGPLFGRAWMATVGLSKEEIQKSSMVKIFGLAFIFELIMSFNMALFFTGPLDAFADVTPLSGAFYGFLIGFGWIFFAMAVNSLYEQKSWKFIFIDGGYWTVAFTVMGLILGAWP